MISEEQEVIPTPENDNLVDDSVPNTSAKKRKVEILNATFEYCLTPDTKEKFAKCKKCLQQKGTEKIIKMKDGNTTGVKRHLRNYHEDEFQLAFPNAGNSQEKFDQTKLNDMTVEWIAKKYLPITFFNDETTQTFFKYINKDAKFPLRTELRSLTSARFKNMKEELKKLLQKNRSKFSFDLDSWSSVAGKSYFGINGHYIDDNWSLHSITLEFTPSNGQHTGKSIAKLFYDCVKDYGLMEKIEGITLDNASNNTTFIQEFSLLMDMDGLFFDSQNQHFRCVAHISNLAAQDFLVELNLRNPNDEEEILFDNEETDDENEHSQNESENDVKYDSPIKKLRLLFKKLKFSEQLRRKLECCCITLNVKMTMPSSDVKTRWNSTEYMIGKGLKMKEPLKLLCSNNQGLQDFLITESEWALLEAAHKYLKYFKVLSDAVCGDKYVTIPLVIIGFNLLLDQIEKGIKKLDELDHCLINEKLRNALFAAREKLLKHYNKCNWIYCAILVLDPRHKIETFFQTEWGKEMSKNSIAKFYEMFKKIYYIPKQGNSTNDETEISQISDVDSDDSDVNLYSFYEKTKKSKRTMPSSSKKQDDWKKEIDDYCKEETADSKTDILLWWKQNQNRFPNLARMARDLLAIQASSVSSERLFSRSSLTIRKHRNRLGNELIRELMCINNWSNQKDLSVFLKTESS